VIGVRYLPCPRCNIAKTRDGKPYWMTRLPTVPTPFRYVCQGCNPDHDPRHGSIEISFAVFSSLPIRTTDELHQDGLLLTFLRDYKFAVANLDQARDLFAAGFMPDELLALARPDEETVA
jgi:hypothetical protein